ncbi:MAG: J domain-containing protein [Myxococcales bacterium]|nr:J domain-containing protein [Myxococcales bacterium]
MDPVQLPIHIARLVQSSASSIDLGAELRSLLADGRRRVTVGLGPGVDLPLLDEELYSADVGVVDRELVVAAIRAEPDGYVVERGWSNFGVYVWQEAEPLWQSVPYMGFVRGLRPGDQLALGSTPADALKLQLPESPIVAPPVARRTHRQTAAARQRVTRPTTPPAPPPVAAPPPPTPTAPPSPSGPVDRARYQHAFDVALMHWQYAMVTIGTDPESVIVIDDPALEGLRAAIGRNLEQPERGYDLFVKDPGPRFWVRPAGEEVRALAKGDIVRLKGPGNLLGFQGYMVELPPPAVPTPRFSATEPPEDAEIADVMGVPLDRLNDRTLIKARYRALARRFHPDRHGGEPGHLSRFLELTACFDTWSARSD